MTKKRYGEARLYLGGATLALLAGTWSALSAHDLSSFTNQTQAIPVTTSTQSPTTSTQATGGSSATSTQSTTHSRTRAS
jgi:hypothetical protein